MLLSFPICIVLFSSSCYWALLFTLLRFPFHVVFFFPHYWVFLFTLLCSPPRVIGLSSSCCLLSSSHCFTILLTMLDSPIDVVLSFTLLGFPSHYCSPFCIVWLSSLTTFLFQVEGSLHYCSRWFALLFALFCSPFHASTIGVFLFVEKSCTTRLHSFLQDLGVVGSRELKTCIFSISFFSLCLFPFLLFFISCLFVLCFIFIFVLIILLLVCGVRLVTNSFGDKHKPLHFWQFYIFAYLFCSIIFLLACKCFTFIFLACCAIFYLYLFVNVLHHTWLCIRRLSSHHTIKPLYLFL